MTRRPPALAWPWRSSSRYTSAPGRVSTTMRAGVVSAFFSGGWLVSGRSCPASGAGPIRRRQASRLSMFAACRIGFLGFEFPTWPRILSPMPATPPITHGAGARLESLAFSRRLGMNGHASNLRKLLADAVGEHAGDVVNLRDRQAALHRALARDHDAVLRAPHLHVGAFGQFMVLAAEVVDVVLNGAAKVFHRVGGGDMAAQRLDVNVHLARAGDFRQDVALEFGGRAVRLHQRQALVHLEVQVQEQLAIKLINGDIVDGQAAA